LLAQTQTLEALQAKEQEEAQHEHTHLLRQRHQHMIAGGRVGDRRVLVVTGWPRLWSWKSDKEEEVVLAALQEEVLSESKEKRQDLALGASTGSTL
jgi:hypothetical protein